MTKEQKEQLERSKQELKDYIYNKKWIEEKLLDIKERRVLLENISGTISDMPRGTPKVVDKKAEELSKIIDDTNEMEIYVKQLKEKQLNIENKIDKEDNDWNCDSKDCRERTAIMVYHDDGEDEHDRRPEADSYHHLERLLDILNIRSHSRYERGSRKAIDIRKGEIHYPAVEISSYIRGESR